MLGLTPGCRRPAEPVDRHAPRSVPATRATDSHRASDHDSSRFAVENSYPGVSEPHVGRSSVPTELMVDENSAYNAGLFVDEDTIYVLTDHVAHRFVPGESPRQIPLENGTTGAVTRSGLVYWSTGAIWQVAGTGGKARRLASLDHQPQFFMAAGDDFAWLEMHERDRFLIQTLARGRVRTLVDYAGRIETAAMGDGRVFFVGRDRDSSWRIGSVSTRGGQATYAAPKTGPTPAKLAIAGDVFYYDVQSGEVRRLSADLSHEETLLKDLVCSPLAVSVRIYCPNMDGMFELARHRGSKPMPLFPSRERITAVAASSRYLVWLKDAGADRLSLNMIPLVLDDAENAVRTSGVNP